MEVAERGDHPNTAYQQLLVLFNNACRDFGILDAQVTERRFIAIFLLIQTHRDTINYLETAALTHDGFHFLRFIGPHVVIRQNRFDVFQSRSDHLRIVRGAVHAQQILQHIHGHISTLFHALGEVLTHHATRKVHVEQRIQIGVMKGIGHVRGGR